MPSGNLLRLKLPPMCLSRVKVPGLLCLSEAYLLIPVSGSIESVLKTIRVGEVVVVMKMLFYGLC